MAFEVVFLAHAPDAEPEEHRCVIETPKCKVFVRVVKDQGQADDMLRCKDMGIADNKIVQDYASDLRNLLAKSSISEQRSFLKSFVERIEVGDLEVYGNLVILVNINLKTVILKLLGCLVDKSLVWLKAEKLVDDSCLKGIS